MLVGAILGGYRDLIALELDDVYELSENAARDLYAAVARTGDFTVLAWIASRLPVGVSEAEVIVMLLDGVKTPLQSRFNSAHTTWRSTF